MLQKVVAWNDKVCRPNVLYIVYQKWLMLTGTLYFGFIIVFKLLDLSFCFIISVVIFFGDTGISW